MGLWYKNSLKKRLIIYFMATIVIMSAMNIFPYYSISVLMNKMSSTFEMNVELNQLNKTLEKLNYAYESYLTTKHSKSLDDYYRYSNELWKEASEIHIDNSSMDNILIMKDIKNMISNYLDEMDEAVKARRARMVDDYLYHYQESVKIRQYIVEYIQKLNNNMFFQNTDRYMSVSKSIRIMETMNIGLLSVIFVLSIVLILWFTYRITKPIFELSKAADEITHGNFNVPSVKVNSNDEIGIMAEAFNRMTESIRQYINEINEKVGLERKLQEKEMENLIIRTNLREAELHALQAQINPHFLFNTLNAGAQLAMMEGADRACSFIENAAELFRYNMRNLDKPVTIGDEIRNVENYMHLLNERFADKIEFTMYKEESILERKIPCMILQPIVENAFIHGISDVEYPGRISLRAELQDGFAVISIKDNGKGMSAEKIQEIIKRDMGDKPDFKGRHEGHTNGIGMNNILSRLKIFYSRDEIMEIFSEPGQGTEVVLHIPIES
ncbi:sensor histidine kinase [Sinanaerobacter chloroacetimidivorans]|uniref:Sensor histidine kinase n=1 Tax=Sinanaerobacter chloroacetimidivorans TaxID=2818044 RepID=A0A8J7W339_9FIRM|nr:sensor histidine kinase [Sinanaerobacter chloroacetimidivorans]MBR0598216.1 sensor histidine kinase [Sinanaerobacter chloroacetimidivorans]